VVALLIGVGVLGWTVYRQVWHETSTVSVAQTGGQHPKTARPATKPNLYAGWKSTCGAAMGACFKYPSDWTASPYGGLQNPADTAYVDYQVADNKDQAGSTVYIAVVDDLTTPGQSLTIVGYVFNNVPSFAVYDSAAVTAAGAAAGQTARLVTGNPTFTGEGGARSTFVATPGANGLAAITTTDQAKAWFTTDSAKTCLQILQSFYVSP
jgi:hypothetical protein